MKDKCGLIFQIYMCYWLCLGYNNTSSCNTINMLPFNISGVKFALCQDAFVVQVCHSISASAAFCSLLARTETVIAGGNIDRANRWSLLNEMKLQ